MPYLSVAGVVTLLNVICVAAALTAPTPTTAPIEQDALAQAREIRAEVDARYRAVPGRRLAVTEASTTGVVDSLSLVTSVFEPTRVVPAAGGIYFAICSAGATCPYPARWASWPAAAFLPGRQALELVLRTLLETPASLVVVALPTAKPVWLVVEREDLFCDVDASALLDRLATDPARVDAPLREVVARVIRPRLFLPIEIVRLSPAHVTAFAVSLEAP